MRRAALTKIAAADHPAARPSPRLVLVCGPSPAFEAEDRFVGGIEQMGEIEFFGPARLIAGSTERQRAAPARVC